MSEGQAYEGARKTGTFMANWPAHLLSADREILPARYDLVARTRDLVRNDPIALSGVSRKKNAAIGRGWRFSSKPMARALGLTPQQARELGQTINSEWIQHCESVDFEIDAERKGNLGHLLRIAATHLIQDGEFLAQVDYADDDDMARYKTCLRMIDPDRLATPIGQAANDNIRGGVETNDRDVPIAYWIRQRHPADIGHTAKVYDIQRHPRYATPLGRPNILHGFDQDRAGQTRGVTRFAAALKAFRGFGKFTDATIESAAINALILGYMKSNGGPAAVGEHFSAEDMAGFEEDREKFYEDNPVTLGGARLPVIPHNDELVLATASKDVTSFEGFTRAIIRLIASALGVTYEELSMDYSQTNYSSARAAMVHAWAEIQAFMGILETKLVRPYFMAWLEEAFDAGYITIPAGAPGFYGAKTAYCAGRWMGPGRGYIDPTKEILAAAARIEAGVSTLEDECADQGKDYEEVLDQLAFEMQMRAELGLTGTTAAGTVEGVTEGAEPKTAPEDERPEPSKSPTAMLGRFVTGVRSALGQIRGFANSAEHEAALDARPSGQRAA